MLTAQQQVILRHGGNECAHSNALAEERRRGTYHCAACGHGLFHSADKLVSSCGWPVFASAVEGALSYSSERYACAGCGGWHGARRNGRHVNSGVVLEFRPQYAKALVN